MSLIIRILQFLCAADITIPYYMRMLNVVDSKSQDDYLRIVSQEVERLRPVC
jgi:hypothetical protein